MCENEGPSLEEQVALVKSVGYDDYYLTGAVNDVGKFERYLKASLDAGLGFNAAFECFDVKKTPKPEDLEHVEQVVSQLPDYARLEIALVCDGMGNNVGDASQDDRALAWLGPISCILEKYNIEASLYPHFAFLLETLEDAIRLARKVDHPKMKVMFTSYHWFRVRNCEARGQPDYPDLFTEAGNLLNAVNLCGSRVLEKEEDAVGGMNPSIEPIDAGTKDVPGILAELERIGFTGPIGIQGYSVNDSPESALRRSFSQLKQLID